jgi:hypothetical protein
MDSLPSAAAVLIAAYLEDERDIAALRCTNRLFRSVMEDAGIWGMLLKWRFRTGAPPDDCQTASNALSDASSAPSGVTTAEQRFRQLASLKRPAIQLDRVNGLDGRHLQASMAL